MPPTRIIGLLRSRVEAGTSCLIGSSRLFFGIFPLLRLEGKDEMDRREFLKKAPVVALALPLLEEGKTEQKGLPLTAYHKEENGMTIDMDPDSRCTVWSRKVGELHLPPAPKHDLDDSLMMVFSYQRSRTKYASGRQYLTIVHDSPEEPHALWFHGEVPSTEITEILYPWLEKWTGEPLGDTGLCRTAYDLLMCACYLID